MNLGNQHANIFSAWMTFRVAEEKFLKSWKELSAKCEHQEEVVFRKSLAGSDYHAKKCKLKDDNFNWNCEWHACPYTTTGLRIQGGKRS